jgi:UDP-N-acetylglucosamine 2-epimerase (non-hydrolysing)
MKKIRALIAFGTRPEAIKMAPLVKLLQQDERFEPIVLVTAQHRQMLDQVLNLFEIRPDFDLDIMTQNQSLSELTSSILVKSGQVINQSKPHIVLVHGDTATTLSVSLAAYYERVPIAHVEAGLRTFDIYNPWPEEANRKITTALTKLHFAPTKRSKDNLLREGVAANTIFITGNTVIDALLMVTHKIHNDSGLTKQLKETFSYINFDKPLILVTGHRRESFGSGFEQICEAIAQTAKEYPEAQVIYPVHLNPKVQEPVNRLLGKIPNVFLIPPQSYLEFVYLMNLANIILTDSGGIQEEAPSLNKPVLVMRDVTERPEAVEAGTVELVGTSKTLIYQKLSGFLNQSSQESFKKKENPYGDGTAAAQIVSVLVSHFRDQGAISDE